MAYGVRYPAHAPIVIDDPTTTPPVLAPSPRDLVWLPRRSRGGDAVAAAGLVLGLIAAGLVGLAVGQEPGPRMVLLLGGSMLAGLAATAALVWFAGYRHLAYELGDHDLRVWWLGGSAIVSYTAIDGVFPGQRLVGASTPSTPSWPGIYVGGGRIRGVGRLRFYATSRDPSELTLVTAGAAGLVLSPIESAGFRAALIERVEAHVHAPVAPDRVRVVPPAHTPWTAVRDPWLLALVGLSLLTLLLTVAVVALNFSLLPDRVPLRFDGSGQPLEIGFKGDLFRLPLGGFGVLLADVLLALWLHPREPALARLLLAGGFAVQVIGTIGAVRLVQ